MVLAMSFSIDIEKFFGLSCVIIDSMYDLISVSFEKLLSTYATDAGIVK